MLEISPHYLGLMVDGFKPILGLLLLWLSLS
jgi:hypothetical protein